MRKRGAGSVKAQLLNQSIVVANSSLSVKKPHCPREAKQWGRNREEAESNVITVTET
jgi:hypothetical protein